LQEIITQRLSLRLMTEDFLQACLREDKQKTDALIGLNVSPDWFEEKDLIRLRMQDYRTDSKYISWGLHAVGLRKSKEMIGFFGFHTRPNPDYLHAIAPNSIEFGYTIFLPFRRYGFAEEAIGGMLNWAAARHPLDSFIASVSPTNLPSTALVKKLGFTKIGEQIDEVDGLEFVYSLAAAKLDPLS
jgi:[ribosomal protein S5]-alanine N-acetyltransferase